jgi:SAM-dependent methyltransferase
LINGSSGIPAAVIFVAMSSEIPSRFEWAADLIAPADRDFILEVGFGTGILLGLLLARNRNVKLTGVERSAAMVNSATKKLGEFIKEKRLGLVGKELGSADLYDKAYSKIIMFNVPFTRRAGSSELDIVRRLLKPGGLLLCFYQFPQKITMSDATSLKNVLEEASFEVVDDELKSFGSNNALCLVATHKKK